LFTASTMRRFLRQYRELLSKLVYKPEVRLSKLDILSDDEIKTLESWNATSAPFDRSALVHELFEAQVDMSPDAAALVFEGRNMSYRELDARANQIAHALRAAGVGSGTLVGLCVERSQEMVAAFIGILKAGGAYVPLDPAYPKDRLGYMIEDSRMPVLLTTDGLNDELDEHAAKVVTLASTQAAPVTRLGQKTTEGENPAYVIYTSGSTGKPKGVVVPHRSVINFIGSIQKQPGLTNQDTLVAVTTLSFDIAVLELHVALCSGACVVVASREEVQDGQRLAALLESATVMQATPSTWRMLIDAGWKGRPESQGALPAFKALVGGEALPQALAAQLLERTGALWNMYGPTETTVWSTCQRVENPQSIRIGRPIANTTIEVLDAHLSREPIGVVGELYIGGDGVTLGYLHRPDLTAERFIADPFRPGQKLYKTGDLARWMSDGTVDYIGRNDHQVKVRGFRIELGEIEAALAGHAALASNVVLVREDVPGDVRIVAYVIPREGEDYTDTELRKLLRKSLPDYMIPQQFVELNKLPLTPNGKVDRKALPAPAGSASSARALVSPRTDAERMLAQLFQESLKVSDLSVHDNFFDLGGHSLLCFQVIAKVQEKTGVRLNPRIMLMNTLEQTAVILVQEQESLAARAHPEQADAVASIASAETSSFAQKLLRKLGLN
jgi:amino acid adenylation domain-containing protein